MKHHGIKPASGSGPCLSWYVSADTFFASSFFAKWRYFRTSCHYLPYLFSLSHPSFLARTSLSLHPVVELLASGGGAVGGSGPGDYMCWVFVGIFLPLIFWQSDSKESDGISSAGERVWRPSPYRASENYL